MPPWDFTPVTGIGRVDPTAFGAYYNGAAEAPPLNAPEAQAAPYRPEPLPHTPYPELSTGMLLRPVKPPPSEGWRRLVYDLSGRLINLGESPRAARHNNLVAQVNRPLRGCYRIALLSLKGGVGKTTITATLGSTFASLRGDRVVAVDANPDRGTLSQKIPLETAATVRQLLRDAGIIERYSEVRRYTSQGPSGMEVLASETDPAISEAFGADDYRRTLDILERFYGLVLTDCGPGLLNSVMSSVLEKADVLLVVASASIDGARSASATLDWLDAHGHQELVRNSIAVINGGAATHWQGRHEQGGRSLLPPLPRRAAGAVRPSSGRGRRDQPGPVAAKDPRSAHRAGSRCRRWVPRRPAQPGCGIGGPSGGCYPRDLTAVRTLDRRRVR